MTEFLSKEEIKQWRSSLEKITLEEFAARLGKKISEDKHTNDLADIVLHGQPVVSSENWSKIKTERITTIAQRAFEREQEISPSPFSISKIKLHTEDTKAAKDTKSKKTDSEKIADAAKNTKSAVTSAKSVKSKKADTKKAAAISEKTVKSAKAAKAIKEVLSGKPTGDILRDDIRIAFKKALTDREQKVFDYFSEHKNEVVYAKDLAMLLDLPRDYVYKYIKNLRAKIDGDNLENADKGGFILHV